MNNQTNQTPIAAPLNIVNNPQPMVVCATLTDYGFPTVPPPIVDLTPMDAYLNLKRNNLQGYITVNVADAIGTVYMEKMCPFESYPTPTFSDLHIKGQLVNPIWTHINSSQYVQPVFTITWTLVAPDPVLGKFKIRYIIRSEKFSDSSNHVNAHDEQIVHEWDLSVSKSFSIRIKGLKFGTHRMARDRSTAWIARRLVGDGNSEFSMVSTRLFARNQVLGKVFLELMQPLQKGNMFPDSYTMIVQTTWNESTFYDQMSPIADPFDCVPITEDINGITPTY